MSLIEKRFVPIGLLGRRSLFVLVGTFALGSLAMDASPAFAQFQDLAKRIPDTANTIVIFNVKKILSSPLAVRENWKQKQAQAFASGMILLPPQASRVVLASQLDLEFMQPIWEVAVLDLNVDPSMESIARRQQGRRDMVAGASAVVLPDDTYLVQFGPRTVGRMSPANRQSVARWVRQSQAKSDLSLSPYLTEAVSFAEEAGTEIIMSMDLQDVITPEVAREKMMVLKALAGKQVDVFTIARIISSIRGVTLGVVIGERPYGKLKIDFGQDVTKIADLAKPMLLEILANRSAMIDDFSEWKAEVKGRQVSIEGYLSASGMRQIFSIVDAPSQSMAADEAGDEEGKSAINVSGKSEASLQHFKSVDQLLNDLRQKKAATIGQRGVWLNNYARYIDRLPILNVDDDLLNFSAYISDQMRIAATAVQGIGIRSAARSAQVYGARGYVATGYGYGGYRYGRWGRYGQVDTIKAVGSERRAIRAQEKAAGATSARATMQEVENAMAAIRRTMTQRYQIEF